VAIYRWINDEIVLAISESTYDYYDTYLIDLKTKGSYQHIISQYPTFPKINMEGGSASMIWADIGEQNGDQYVTQMDLQTGENRILFTKDCKNIYGESMFCELGDVIPSPFNSQYLALLENPSGYIEGITIINVGDQSIVYQAYTETDSPFAWIDSNSFIFEEEVDLPAESKNYMQVTISDTGTVETRLENVYKPMQDTNYNSIQSPMSADGYYILSYEYQIENKSRITQVFLYDVLKQERYPITESIKDLGYGFTAYWNDDGTIEIRVYRDFNDIGKWLVSIKN